MDKRREEERKKLVETNIPPTHLLWVASLAGEGLWVQALRRGRRRWGMEEGEGHTHTHGSREVELPLLTTLQLTCMYVHSCLRHSHSCEWDSERSHQGREKHTQTITVRTLDEKALNTRDLHNTTTENDKRSEKEVIVLMKVLSISQSPKLFDDKMSQ